jgi:hypothetical protein
MSRSLGLREDQRWGEGLARYIRSALSAPDKKLSKIHVSKRIS